MAKAKAPDYLVPETGMAMSRDSQHFRVTPNISGTGKATNVELVNKTGNIKYAQSASLTNKTANIKYKTYQFTKL